MLNNIGLIIALAIIFLLSMLLTIANILYWSKKRRKVWKSSNYELLTSEDCEEGISKSIPMSVFHWERQKLTEKRKFERDFRCFCKELNREVMVKELTNEDKMVYTRYFQELKIMSELRHAHITRILGMNYTSTLKIITPLRKSTLNNYLLKLEQIDKKDLFRFCVQIIDAMIYLHSKGIIHDELKASNVLVKDEFTVEVTNFGLMMIKNENNIISDNFMYVPLEYLKGDTRQPTKEGDVWSFGVTAWEIFTYCKAKPYEEHHIDSPIQMVELLSNGTKLSKPSLLHSHSLWSDILKCNIVEIIF